MFNLEKGAVFFISRRLLTGNLRLIIPAMAGIIITTASAIIALALLRGFEVELTDSLTRTGPHISVTSEEGGALKDPEKLLPALRDVSGVKSAFPVLTTQALLQNQDLLAGVEVLGIPHEDSGAEELMPGLNGNWIDEGFSILIGKRLAEELKVEVGDEIIFKALDESEPFVVTGIFNSGSWEIDSSVAIIPLEINRLLYRQDDWAQEIWLRIDKPIEAYELSNRVFESTGLTATPWQERQASIAAAMKLQRRMALAFLFLIAGVASMGVIATIRIFILGRMKTLGTLMALGVRQSEIVASLTSMTGMFSLISTLTGSALALITIMTIQQLKPELPGEFYNIGFLPVQAAAYDFVLTSIIILVFAILSALKASSSILKLDPSEILRAG